MRKIHILNLTSGTSYKIEEDEVKNLQQYEIPLSKSIPKNCKKCYGIGFIGTTGPKKVLVPCLKCINKCIDRELAKQLTSKTTNESNRLLSEERNTETVSS